MASASRRTLILVGTRTGKVRIERGTETAILFAIMPVPLLDLSEQYRALPEPIREAIDAVLTSHRFILGSRVKALEAAICARS
jgi:hypothetical protein